jgi:hypothetical protein
MIHLNTFGRLGISATFAAFVSTPAFALEAATLWRAELSITVCDEEDAGTDSRIYASLGGEEFALNLGLDDFKRGRTYRYDLPAPNTAGQIEFLMIRNNGSDRLCIQEIALALNHPAERLRTQHTVFTDMPYQWISEQPRDSNRYLAVWQALRNSPTWNLDGRRALIANLPVLFATTPIQKSTITQMVESYLGDLLTRTDKIGWGGKDGEGWVELSTTSNPQIARISVDLGKRGRNGRLAEIDFSFELEFACDDASDTFRMTPQNFNVDARGLFGGRLWEDQVMKRLRKVAGQLAVGLAVPEGICSRARPRFDQNGNLRLL